MMRHARTATLVIAISLPASVVVAQPRTWTLWEVSEITEAKRVGSTFETTPTNYLALPMERDLDRGACELVKEGKIRNQHRMYESARPIPDGVMLTTPLGDKTQVITTKYLCLRAGEKPPEGRVQRQSTFPHQSPRVPRQLRRPARKTRTAARSAPQMAPRQ
jgi:hypothetical protein